MADAPVDELLARVEDLAKGWLLAVLEDAPLDQAPSILAGALPRDGPRICDAVVRALGDEGDLRRLGVGGPLEALASKAGELVGARDLRSTARAVDALQAVIWSALREELSHPDADQIAELAERLTLVIELVRVAALRWTARDGGSAERPAAGPSAVVEPVQRMGPPNIGPAPDPREAAEMDYSGYAGAAGGAQAANVPASGGPRPGEVADGPDPAALWLSALEDEVNRALRSNSPLALIVADLDEAERVLAVEPPSEASAAFGRFAQAVRGVLRRRDILVCETDTRAWIISRDTGRGGAQALGSRIARAVGEVGTWRGAPFRVSVGVAILGEDGNDPSSLVEAAEEASFAAAASGIGIVRGVPSPASHERPEGPEGPQLAS